MKILVAADGSKFAHHALDYLIKHLDMFGGQPDLHLAHVRLPVPGRAAAALSRDMVQKYYQDECRKAIAPAKRLLDKAGVRHKDVMLVGDPGAELAAYAVKGKFDLVVMGSHGHGALAGLVLGSSATKVLANCKVPVLIVR